MIEHIHLLLFDIGLSFLVLSIWLGQIAKDKKVNDNEDT